MTVLVGRVVHILKPFLKLPVTSDLHRRKFCGSGFHGVAERLVQTEYAGSLRHIREHIVNKLVVHGAAGGHRPLLGRHRRSHDQIAVARVFGKEIQEEQRRAPEDVVIVRQELPVPGVEIMLPYVLGEPGSAAGPHPRRSIVHRSGHTPYVGVVMGSPAPGPVHGGGSAGSAGREVPDKGEERPVSLAQVRHLRRPVVHLGVDVDGVLAVPGGVGLTVPYALEVRRLSAGL